MREILFRARRVDNGEWVEGVPYAEYMICGMTTAYYDDEVPMSKYSEFDYIEVIPETIGQYTGLKDKNGVKIYEGDLVMCRGERLLVKNYLGCFGVFDIYENWNDLYCKNDVCEVIGNIHDKESE